MKKILLLISAGFGILNLNAQESAERRNDIMISPIELIAIPMLNISYEKLLNENSGIGINGIFYLGNSSSDFDDDENGITQISPYYRMYFGKKYASGFFVEGFVPITMTKDFYYEPYYGPGYGYAITKEEKNTTIGIGVGFGGKWVARKNIVFEASMGIARRFGMEDQYGSEITGKGMLGIGYRF